MSNFKNNSETYNKNWKFEVSTNDHHSSSSTSNTGYINDKNKLPLPLTSSDSTSSSSTNNTPITSTSSTQVSSQQPTPKQQMDLKIKRGWEMAKSPAKNIFMTGFFLWMIGNGINIFTMPVIIYAVINPIKAIFQTNTMFSRFNDCKNDITQMKLMFIAIQLALLSVTLYKCSSMGLLPITPSDWISSLPIKKAVEFSSGS